MEKICPSPKFSRQYNTAWDQFRIENKNPSQQQIEQFGRDLSSKYKVNTNY
jgi:hypothetical protein